MMNAMEHTVHKLIIVPCHASFKSDTYIPLPEDIENDDYWALQPFQKGEPPFYLEHIREGVKLTDDESLLVFSGGRTREESGRIWSESKTYDEIAKTLPNYVDERAELEEYARDSFQNLDFSIRKFKHLFGHEPDMIYVIGWKFKEKRFQFHADTLQIRNASFKYVGVNNPRPEDLAGALIGEEKTLKSFMENPHGDEGVLLEKRLLRDPWQDGSPDNY